MKDELGKDAHPGVGEEYSRQSEEQLQKVTITHEHESLESWKQFCVTGSLTWGDKAFEVNWG